MKHEAQLKFPRFHDLSYRGNPGRSAAEPPGGILLGDGPRILNCILALIKEGRTALTPDYLVEYGLGLILKEESPSGKAQIRSWLNAPLRDCMRVPGYICPGDRTLPDINLPWMERITSPGDTSPYRRRG